MVKQGMKAVDLEDSFVQRSKTVFRLNSDVDGCFSRVKRFKIKNELLVFHSDVCHTYYTFVAQLDLSTRQLISSQKGLGMQRIVIADRDDVHNRGYDRQYDKNG